MSTLYLVATPIGNLEDITLRALRILKQVSLVAAEDTRTARNLLTHFDISTPVTSYFEHNKIEKLETILDALDQGDVAVISEAGMPGLSDPGYELVRAALARGFRVEPIPGPSALTTALVASGLPTDQFVFLGFLPRQPSARRKALKAIAGEPRTLVAYEAPHRIEETLGDIAAILGDRHICVARELTKLHEEYIRGSVTAAHEHFQAQTPRGEFTLIIAGATESDASQSQQEWDDQRVRAAVQDLIASGLTRTDAVKRVTQSSGWDRRAVYRLAIGK